MITFWVVTGLLALAMAGVLMLALLRGRRATGPAEAFDMQVYRDQLAEVDRDRARGVISQEDAERLRTEISRRILAADAKAQAGAGKSGQPRAPALAAAGLIAVLVIGGGYGLYAVLGAPGYGDLGLQARIAAAEAARSDRPGQQEAEAQQPVTQNPDIPEEYRSLVTRLRAAVAERPDDLQGLALLARSEAALGNYTAAYRAQQRIVELRGEDATARDYADLADMMVLAAGGYVSPEAEEALQEALARDPENGVARYYAGLMLAQTGRPDRAFRIWDRLLRESPQGAPWLPPIRAQIEDLAWRAGINDYRPPAAPAPRGPSAEDIEAAGEMSAEDRRQMIRGMVNQLSDRLATEGGPPEDWARLISSLMVLGEEAQAIAIWNNAQEVFADAPEALDTVRAAARQAGLVP